MLNRHQTMPSANNSQDSVTPPRSKSALERIVYRYADINQIAVKRVMRWISFMVIAGALDRAKTESGGAAFVLKGGITLEMRLGLRSRATKDLDATFWSDNKTLADSLDEVLRHSYGLWTLARDGESRNIGMATQIFVKLFFAGKSWATAQLEISIADDEPESYDLLPAMDLTRFGLDGPTMVACLPLAEQIAQKMHAVTRVWPPTSDGMPRANERFRDLLDLFVLQELINSETLARAVRVACERTFAARAEQAWPPQITVYPSWPAAYARLAAELELPVEIEAARQMVQGFIERVAATTGD